MGSSVSDKHTWRHCNAHEQRTTLKGEAGISKPPLPAGGIVLTLRVQDCDVVNRIGKDHSGQWVFLYLAVLHSLQEATTDAFNAMCCRLSNLNRLQAPSM